MPATARGTNMDDYGEEGNKKSCDEELLFRANDDDERRAGTVSSILRRILRELHGMTDRSKRTQGREMNSL